MKKDKEMICLTVNDKDIIIISDCWKGFPLIGYPADIILCSRMILKKHKKSFLPALKDARIVYLDDKRKAIKNVNVKKKAGIRIKK